VTPCRDVQDKLPDYLYGLLPDWEMESTRAHMESCEDCSAAYAKAVEEFRMLDEWKVQGPGRDGYGRFLQRLGECSADEITRARPAPRVIQAQERPLLGRFGGVAALWHELPVGAKIAAASAGVLSLVATLVALLTVLQAPSAFATMTDRQRQAHVEGLIMAGELPDAIETVRVWVSREPQSSRAHVCLADIYERLGEQDRAVREYRVATKLDPQFTEAHLRMGALFASRAEYTDARDAYDKALDSDGFCTQAHDGLARVALQRDDVEQADKHAGTALALSPDDPEIMATHAEVRRRAGDSVQARAGFRAALNAAPTCAEALFGMAATVQSEGDERLAQHFWQRFLAVESDTQRAWLARNGLVELSQRQLSGVDGWNQRPVMSPDGKQIAFAGRAKGTDSSAWRIYTMPADGSTAPKLVTSSGPAVWPTWTLDSKDLLFNMYYEARGKRTRIFRTSASGAGEPVCLTPSSTHTSNAVPIPGTQRMLYSDREELYSAGLHGSDVRKLPIDYSAVPSERDISYLCVSPDGVNVIFGVSDWAGGRGPATRLYLAPLDGASPAKSLTDEDTEGRWGCANPSWSPDGKRILFADDKADPNTTWTLYAMVLGDDSGPHALLSRCARASWSPDGTQIICDRRVWPASQIHSITLGGERPTVVQTDAPCE